MQKAITYIGLDVHQATISAAVLDSVGSLVMEAILETKSATIVQFLLGIRGSLQVTFEEGTWAAWLHDLLKPQVTRVVVCDPRKTGLGSSGIRMIQAMPASWQNCCIATSWNRFTTPSMACVRCENWRAPTSRSRGISRGRWLA